MALVNIIASKLPGWMRVTRYVHWSRLAEAVSLTYDVLIEGLFMGRLASMPGQTRTGTGFPSHDALPLIGRDRRIYRGLDEEVWQYADRLRNWRQIHREAGVGPAVLKRLSELLRPNAPMIRVVTGGGEWWTREADEGGFTKYTQQGDGFTLPASGKLPDGGAPLVPYVPHPWLWGGSPNDARFWPIIYVPVLRIGVGLNVGDPAFIVGDPTITIGTSATPATVEATRNFMLDCCTAGVLPPRIIIAFDPASFDPLSSLGDPGMPNDEDWELCAKTVIDDEGGFYLTPSRLDTARYWIGKEPDEYP